MRLILILRNFVYKSGQKQVDIVVTDRRILL